MKEYQYRKAELKDKNNILNFLSMAYKLPLENISEMFSFSKTASIEKKIYFVYKQGINKPISLIGAIKNDFGLNFCYFAIHVKYRKTKEVWNITKFILDNEFDLENISSHVYTTIDSVVELASAYNLFPSAYINIMPNTHMYYLYRKGKKFNFKPCYVPKYFQSQLKQILTNLNIEIINSYKPIANRKIKNRSDVKIIKPSPQTYDIEFTLIDEIGYDLYETIMNSNNQLRNISVLAFNLYDHNILDINIIDKFLDTGYRYCGFIFNLGSLPRFCLQKMFSSELTEERDIHEKFYSIYKIFLKDFNKNENIIY